MKCANGKLNGSFIQKILSAPQKKHYIFAENVTE